MSMVQFRSASILLMLLKETPFTRRGAMMPSLSVREGHSYKLFKILSNVNNDLISSKDAWYKWRVIESYVKVRFFRNIIS